jgi:hypothetical protein
MLNLIRMCGLKSLNTCILTLLEFDLKLFTCRSNFQYQNSKQNSKDRIEKETVCATK